ncbi:hypothetical protein [Acidilutibacter cellobiosedens]|uniref:hypothetical protein n=1 Tax=Acidilutibacter cellobiosedens TaxID=2507161 RepID=UPI00137588BC|nr:hypothetical protein [Acidilutibacter cellobiosedens]
MENLKIIEYDPSYAKEVARIKMSFQLKQTLDLPHLRERLWFLKWGMRIVFFKI